MLVRPKSVALGLVFVLGCGDGSDDGAADDGTGGSDTTGATAAGTTTAGMTTATATTAAGTDSADTSGGDPTTDPATSDATESTGTVVETIPVFVALADGGWTATSCDRGRTWSVSAFSDEQGDHTQWTGFGGLAFHDGAFVAGLGWGGEGGHILHSTDGRTWTDLPARSFVDDGAVVGYAIYTAGVAHDGDGFVAFSQSVWRSSDGHDWHTEPISLPPGAEQLRQLRGFADAGVLVASVESQSGNQHAAGHFVVVSDDGGVTWSEGTGYTSGCSDPIQHWGDIELLGDVLLVGTRDLCRSPDRGATWSLVPAPIGEDVRDLARTDDAFLALSGTRVLRSTDGEQWTELGDAGIAGRAVAHGGGAFVVVGNMGTEFAYSDDGASWSAATVRGATGEVWVRDLVVGEIQGVCE